MAVADFSRRDCVERLLGIHRRRKAGELAPSVLAGREQKYGYRFVSEGVWSKQPSTDGMELPTLSVKLGGKG